MKTTRALAAALVPLLLALSGCSHGGSDDPTKALGDARKKLDQTSGVHLVLSTDKLPAGVDGVLSADGTGTHQPAFKGTIKVVTNHLTVNVPVVSVDRVVYAELPFTKKFVQIDPEDYGAPDPAQLMDTVEGLSSWLSSVKDPKKGGDVRSGSDVLSSYTGTLPGSAVAAVIPSAQASSDFDAVFTIKDNGELDSAKVTGPFYAKGGDVTYTVKFTEYGTKQDITKP